MARPAGAGTGWGRRGRVGARRPSASSTGACSPPRPSQRAAATFAGGTDITSAMDSLSPKQRSQRMARVRSKNTAPELTVRKLLRTMGYGYRLHSRGLPGKPDIVISGRRTAIFVHGCFWHRHMEPLCRLARLPKSRLDFWLPKLEANRARDDAQREALALAGWRVVVVWECQLKDPTAVSQQLRGALGPPGREGRGAAGPRVAKPPSEPDEAHFDAAS
jgi:DNA mismatch endonuclease (patch repair protein)